MVYQRCPAASQVPCQVDGCHPAAPKLALNDIAIAKGVSQRGFDCSHKTTQVGHDQNVPSTSLGYSCNPGRKVSVDELAEGGLRRSLEIV
jgi:hypothetical protein